MSDTNKASNSTFNFAVPVLTATGLSLASGAANAGMINISHNVGPGGVVLSNGQSYAGTFNISDFLPGGTNMSDYRVLNASVNAMGFSDPDASQSTSYDSYSLYDSSSRTAYYRYYVYYSYRRSGFWYSYWVSGSYSVNASRNVTDNFYERDVTDRFVDLVRDQMGLDVGSDTFAIEVNNHDSSTTFMGQEVLPRSGSEQYGYSYYSQDRYEERDIWSGSLEINQSLSMSSLNDIADDGMMSFSVFANVGQFSLNSLQLDVSLARIASSASNVTEPTTGLLFLLGAGGAFYRFRNRNGKAKRA